MYAIGIDVSKGKSTIAINLNGILLEKPFEIKTLAFTFRDIC